MKILVTGIAGCIGYSLVKKLSKNKNTQIFGIDNINNYYSQKLKKDRLKELGFSKLKKNTEENSLSNNQLQFINTDLKNDFFINYLNNKKFDLIIHLAAQAGVQYSIKNPQSYISNNISATINIYELAKNINCKKIIYASSSSIYGSNSKLPFSENDTVTSPISTYATTKLFCENISRVYKHLYNIESIGLRFFTVYGPWGRPDMSIFKFIYQYFNKQKITLFDSDKMLRDFTYIDDIVNGICGVMKNYKKIIKSKNHILNLGYGKPVQLNKIVNFLIKDLKLDLNIVNKKKLKGDVNKTHADIKLAKKLINYKPIIGYKTGIYNFLQWYVSYYKIKK